MVWLKGFASSHHIVISPILLAVQISETGTQCPGGISATRLVSTSSDVDGAALIAKLRLGGGGPTPSWTVGVECDCCETIPAVYTHTDSVFDPLRTIWTQYSDPQPASPYVVLICGGEFRENDYTSLARKAIPELVVIVLDVRVGGHMHDYTIHAVRDWCCSLVGNSLCQLIICAPECGPWCALRGVGDGPGILFSLDFVDGKMGDDGGRLPAATVIIENLEDLGMIMRAAHTGGAGIIIEHPVSRAEGSPFAIPGRERHSTMWDTSVMKKVGIDLAIEHIYGDQCMLGADTPKTTDWGCTKPFASSAAVVLGKRCDHPSDFHGSLRSDLREKLHFATKTSGVYSSGVCLGLVRVSKEGFLAQAKERSSQAAAVRLHSIKSIPSKFKQLGVVVEGLSASAPESGLFDVSLGSWMRSKSPVLLDSCSDAHMVFERSSFLWVVPSDLPSILVGKEGECVTFAGMGPVMLKVFLEGVGWKGLMLDKAYLPKDGDASQNIISTGRIWKYQGIDFKPNGMSGLIVNGMRMAAEMRNFSPYLSCHLFDAGGEAVQMMSHMTGAPKKKDSYKLAHIRYGHAHDEQIFLITGMRPSRHWKCHICLLMKAITPGVRASTPERPKVLGELLSMDAWGPYSTPAFGTGWTHMLGVLDVGCDFADGIGCKEPTGAICAKFVNGVCERYATVFKVSVQAIEFDNGSVFCCQLVTDVLVKWKVTRHQTVEYMHWQLKMERVWRWMQHDAACMVRFARKGKGFFVHACLHAIDIRSRVIVPAGGTKSKYEIATGIVVDPTIFRTFGADMYGTLLPEKRAQMKLDKADDRAVSGTYVGNMREQAAWKLVNVGGIKTFGAGVINEVKVIDHAPSADDSDVFSEEDLAEARKDDNAYSINGEWLGKFIDSAAQSSSAPAVPVVVPALAVLDRPRREGVAYARPPAIRCESFTPSPGLAVVSQNALLLRSQSSLIHSCLVRQAASGGAC